MTLGLTSTRTVTLGSGCTMHGQFTLGEIKYRASDGGWYSALSPGGSFLVAGDEEPTPLGFWIVSGDGESKETAYKLGLYYEYPLWVGDTQVTSANAASITGSDPVVASYDAESNTLTLDGATIDGDAAGCTTNGNDQYGTIRAELDNLTINVVADSTVTGPSEGSKPYSYGIMAKDYLLTIAGEGTLTASGGSYGYNAGVLANNLVIDGKLSATGVEPTGQPSSVSCGVDAKTSIVVNDGAELTATGFGSRGMAFYDNDATLTSAISGTGWTNAEGTQGRETIASGDYSLSDMKDFKKVQFPEAVVTFSVTLSGGRNAHSAGGNTEQTVEEGVAIESVTFTASDGYHFEDFEPIVSNGVTAKLEDGKVVVSGTPTADVEITIPDAVPTPTVTAHVQRIGWMTAVADGGAAGTTGRSRRMEALTLKLPNGVAGGIEYRGHVQKTGWEKSWKADGKVSGTEGKSRRMEAVQIRLTGAVKDAYDVYYRVHVQRVGWMAWAKNGESAGTQGMSRRAEAVQVVLVAKGGPAPDATYKGVAQNCAKPFARK